MTLVKFHEKNRVAYGKVETVSGTHVTPAVTDALQCSDASAEPTYVTGDVTFLGDSLSRESYSFLKDTYAEVKLTTVPTVLGSLTASNTIDNAPRGQFFQVCGGNIQAFATSTFGYAANSIMISNVEESDVTMSIEYRMASPDDPINDKMFSYSACQGTCDVDFKVGEIPTLVFNLKGESDPTSPTAVPKISPVFGAQSVKVVAAPRETIIVSAKMTPIVPIQGVTFTTVGSTSTATVEAYGHGLSAADSVTITGFKEEDGLIYNGIFSVATLVDTDHFTYVLASAPTAAAVGRGILEVTKNATDICINSLTASNFFGFDFQRFLTSCQEGWAKGAIATDVAVTIVEDQVGGTAFNPDANISKYFALAVKWGTGAGNYITYKWNKVQVASVKETKVAQYMGRDIGLKNTGNSFIIFE